QRQPRVAHHRRNIMRHGTANEVLAFTGRRDRTGFVVRPRPRTDDRRVPHAAPTFEGDSARGRAGCKVTVLIQCDGTNRSVLLPGYDVRIRVRSDGIVGRGPGNGRHFEGPAKLPPLRTGSFLESLPVSLELLQPLGRAKILILHHLEPLLLRKGFRTLT